MSDIKSVIVLLCNHIKLSFNLNVKPEHFRLSKFNKTEDNCISQMWAVLYKLCSEVYPDLLEDDVVRFVKLSFAVMGYNGIEFYCLPPDMSFGSRELLLAVDWLLLTSNVLEVSTRRKLRETPMNMEFDVNVNQQVEGVSEQPVFKAGSLESSLNSILWIAGKIRHNVNAIAETCQARVSFAAKIHRSTTNSCGLPHLSVSETKLVRYPELLPEYLDSVNESSMLMEIHMLWRRKCHVFWEWMATVLAEKECGPQHSLVSVHDKRTLFHVLDTLRRTAKVRILQCQRVRKCKSLTNKDIDSKISDLLCDSSLEIMRGLPWCILQENGKDTEMSILLTDLEDQLQEVRNSYKIKKASVLHKLHELAGQIDNVVVLFPSFLK